MERLKSYKARLILFPRKSGQYKSLDSSKEELQAAKNGIRKIGQTMPIDNSLGLEHGIQEIKKGEMPESTEGGAYRTLRLARSEARLVGVREKRAKLKAEEAEAKKGK